MRHCAWPPPLALDPRLQRPITDTPSPAPSPASLLPPQIYTELHQHYQHYQHYQNYHHHLPFLHRLPPLPQYHPPPPPPPLSEQSSLSTPVQNHGDGNKITVVVVRSSTKLPRIQTHSHDQIDTARGGKSKRCNFSMYVLDRRLALLIVKAGRTVFDIIQAKRVDEVAQEIRRIEILPRTLAAAGLRVSRRMKHRLCLRPAST